jgi:hypothetical protein
MIIAAQKEAIAAGLVSPKNLFNSAKELTKLVGHKNVDMFFTPPGAPPDPNDPTSAPIQLPPPGTHEAQARAEEAQGKLQLEHAKAQADVQIAAQKHQADQQMNAAKIAADAQLKREQLKLEFDLKVQQMNAEFALKREQMAAELALKREQMQLDAQAGRNGGMAQAEAEPAAASERGSSGIDAVRMGGEVG